MSAQLSGHGMTAIEADIMARFDAGERADDIAVSLDLGRRRVTSVIQMFHEGRNDDWQSAARRGSHALLAAIRSAGAQHA